VVSEFAHLVVEAQAQVRWLSVADFVVESGLADSFLPVLIVAQQYTPFHSAYS
jgi:hypothetical protein